MAKRVSKPDYTNLDVVKSAIKQLKAELSEAKKKHKRACKTIAAMHAAAVGEVREPRRGLVEDVAELRKEVLNWRGIFMEFQKDAVILKEKVNE